MVARASARRFCESLNRSEAPEAAVALKTAKPRLVAITRLSVSSKSPLSTAPMAVSAATQSAATSAHESARRTNVRCSTRLLGGTPAVSGATAGYLSAPSGPSPGILAPVRSRMAGHPIFAAVYERLLAANEQAGLREMRAELLRSARGRTLEIGAGTGLNLEHYPDAVTELVLTEPDPHMAKRLRPTLEARSRVASVQVIEARAEELPFEAASFDTVVSALVLCSVPQPGRAVAEVRRVLKPEGLLLYIEHVRDREGTRRARWQDRLERPWGWFLGGCHPNRDTGRLVADAFDVPEPQAGEMPGGDPVTGLVKPLISGVARRPA